MDAVIVSDPGVAVIVKEHGPIPLHVSTQASVLNTYGALAWKELGAVRVVLGREVSIREAGRIQREADIEIEMFVHGAMCMAYSGHCVISNFTQGRDSNRGGCAHSCRFSYDVSFTQDKHESSFVMSSKDLEGLMALPQFVEEGIVSLKVEGRMKGPLYAATTTRVYREALDFYQENKSWKNAPWDKWSMELNKLPGRDATTASLLGTAGAESVYDERDNLTPQWALAGTVISVSEEKGILVACKQSFDTQDQLELVPFVGNAINVDITQMLTPDFQKLERSRPSSLLRIPFYPGVKPSQVLRVRHGERVCAP